MSYFVTVSFDIHRPSEGDYTRAYDALRALRLASSFPAPSGRIDLPDTTVVGFFAGEDERAISQWVTEQVTLAFQRAGLSWFRLVVSATKRDAFRVVNRPAPEDLWAGLEAYRWGG